VWRVIMIGAVLAACGGTPEHGARPGAPLGPPVALVVPALDGGTIDVASHRGQVVVLHVFTTGSLAAAADVDELEAVSTAGKATVIGVALDLDGRALVAPWRTGSSVTYLVGLADDDLRSGRSALGPLREVPITIVLDRAGRPVARIEHQLGPGQLDAAIAAAAASR
jgi:hypothetical protein